MNQKFLSKGFTLIEVMIVISILAVVTTILTFGFTSFNKNQGLQKDVETIVSVLNQARSQTLASKNASAYGVKINTTDVVLFTGTTYDQNSPTNRVFSLNSGVTISNISLIGGGSAVVFQRLTGETSQSGTFSVISSGTNTTKVVTIYKTGLVETN